MEIGLINIYSIGRNSWLSRSGPGSSGTPGPIKNGANGSPEGKPARVINKNGSGWHTPGSNNSKPPQVKRGRHEMTTTPEYQHTQGQNQGGHHETIQMEDK